MKRVSWSPLPARLASDLVQLSCGCCGGPELPRGEGYGKLLMQAASEQRNRLAKPLSYSVVDKVGFYRRFGFEMLTTGMVASAEVYCVREQNIFAGTATLIASFSHHLTLLYFSYHCRCDLSYKINSLNAFLYFESTGASHRMCKFIFALRGFY